MVDIEQLEQALKEAESTYGSDSPQVADCLENYAQLLKTKKIRVLDAANMIARAKVIRSKSGMTVDQQPASGNVIQESLPTGNEYVDCPRCAETIKTKAKICRFCNTELAAPGVPKTQPQSYLHIETPTPAGAGIHAQQDMIYPPRNPRLPYAMALWSLFICGVGQMLLGQVGKGFFILGVTIAIGLISGIGWVACCLAGVVDAYRLAAKLQQGQPIGRWEWF